MEFRIFVFDILIHIYVLELAWGLGLIIRFYGRNPDRKISSVISAYQILILFMVRCKIDFCIDFECSFIGTIFT